MEHRVPCGQAEPGTQVQWQCNLIDKALEAESGGIIVWLEEENKTSPRNDGFPFAMCTRDIVGELRERLATKPRLHIAFGASANFSGLKQIQERFEHRHKDRVVFQTTIQATVREAIHRFC